MSRTKSGTFHPHKLYDTVYLPVRTECFEKLLDLQDPEMTKDGIILLPIAVLAKPCTLNFRYQFMSEKPTSDVRHLGDYFIDWFLGEISKLQDYLRDYVTPVCDEPMSWIFFHLKFC